jgi:biopolymer transport protein ExbB
LEGEENNISQWINYLNVIATIAPMTGLLGTVSGMIGAFQTISSQGMGNPDKFAGNIGEALITTATGLVIGIPSMVFFFVMRNRLNNAMLATIQSANSLLDFLGGDLESKNEDETP